MTQEERRLARNRRTAKWKAEHRTKVLADSRAYARKYRAEHPGKIKSYRDAHKNEAKAASARWRAANPGRDRANLKKWRAENPERVRAQVARRLLRDPDYLKRWKAENPERYRDTHRASERRRRVRKKINGIESFTIQDILRRDGDGCHLCGHKVPAAELSLDHLIPISLGGPHTSQNVAIAHRRCNTARGVRPLASEKTGT